MSIKIEDIKPRIFGNFPEYKRCPICGNSEDKPCILVPIYGTGDGNNTEATPVHVECLSNLTYHPSIKVISCMAKYDTNI